MTVVKEGNSKVNFIVREEQSGKEQLVNVRRMVLVKDFSLKKNAAECKELEELDEDEKIDMEEVKNKEDENTEVKKGKQVEKKYIVDKILDRKKEKNIYYYLIKWKDFVEPTWEPGWLMKNDIPKRAKNLKKRIQDPRSRSS